MAPPGGGPPLPPGMGGAPGLPPMPIAVPKPIKPVTLNKKELKSKIKLRVFMWKRVVLDRSEEGKNQVAKTDLKGLEARWKNKKVCAS